MPDLQPYARRQPGPAVDLKIKVPLTVRSQLEAEAALQERSLSDVTRRVLRLGLIALAQQKSQQLQHHTEVNHA